MKYVSTRATDHAKAQNFDDCLTQGLAPDGGLFVPEKFPHFEATIKTDSGSLADFAVLVLRPFIRESELETNLAEICKDAFNFPVPLKFLAKTRATAVLELFHGPTAAFKDVGARFLAGCLARLGRPATILVATSGDTGGAVAAAFADKPGIPVVILYPKGKISPRQERQLTSWGPGVRAFAVNGSFDDCQRIVKDVLANRELVAKHHFMSANSISVGRLLPQMVYHAKASVDYHAKLGKKPTLVVPTGNLGNAVAALWAKRAGFPIERVILATNANRTLVDYFETGRYQVRPTMATLANAMDVSAPSNFERLMSLYPDISFLKDDVAAVSVTDEEISDAIRRGPRDYDEVFCPHTATAVVAREKMQVEHAVIIATAHPAKFETIVEPLIQKSVSVPPALADVLSRPSVSIDIEPSFEALKTHL